MTAIHSIGMYNSRTTTTLIFHLVLLLATLGCCCVEAAPEPACEAGKLLNSAFVFVKPHANTLATQQMVKEKFTGAGIAILSEHEIDSETIDKDKLIDQHYYAIASKATILPAEEIPVPLDRFQAEFGESWGTVLAEKRACNAMEACKRFDCTAEELNEAWLESKNVVKFGGGFYCGPVSVKDQQPLYVFNAFFMTMRGKFVAPGSSIHCYVVQWDPSNMSWETFRNEFLGPTDPAEAPKGSIRRTVLDKYEELGLKYQPTKGDNGVHASASPFEGLAEKTNWLGMDIAADPFGKALIDGGLSKDLIKIWSVDPRVNLPGGSHGSIFDALEDMNAEDCRNKLIEIGKLN
eukprot:CAMPEP_0119004042 /NCGR_PEP_ID=MMETSP1176-20130426/915_1 /TAXON_ID=265551 /ORGANISM="Synedropsis recta cf, Strain CCMP1620" /LENGTH=348 /DNA_ID=CAMNT_0006955703 /DNA_START=8 /DNA_END=1054 /DNA_ORIENTATION=+